MSRWGAPPELKRGGQPRHLRHPRQTGQPTYAGKSCGQQVPGEQQATGGQRTPGPGMSGMCRLAFLLRSRVSTESTRTCKQEPGLSKACMTEEKYIELHAR